MAWPMMWYIIWMVRPCQKMTSCTDALSGTPAPNNQHAVKQEPVKVFVGASTLVLRGV